MLSSDDPTVPREGDDALVAALMEVERFVSRLGWGSPARLFALVRTRDLLAAEPSLEGQLAVGNPDSLSSIEQEGFHPGDDLEAALAAIAWPPGVDGAAIAVERVMLPADLDAAIPSDPEEAARFVASHPRRQDLRIVAGALRDGSHHGLARVLDHPDDLVGAVDLVPALEAALAHTLVDGPTPTDHTDPTGTSPADLGDHHSTHQENP